MPNLLSNTLKNHQVFTDRRQFSLRMQMFSGKGNAIKPQRCCCLLITESLFPWSLGACTVLSSNHPPSPGWTLPGELALGFNRHLSKGQAYSGSQGPCRLYLSAQAAMTKYHQQVALTTDTNFFHS